MEEIVERLVTIGPIAQMVREAPDNLQQPEKGNRGGLAFLRPRHRPHPRRRILVSHCLSLKTRRMVTLRAAALMA